MRIGFDYRPAVAINSRRRGIGKYTHQLLQALVSFNRGHELLLYSTPGVPPELSGGFEWKPLPRLRRPGRLNWTLDLVTLPRALRRDRLDLFHALEFTSIPMQSAVPVWATVHDLIPFVFWEESVRRTPVDYRWALRRGLKQLSRVDRIITDSCHSRQDIVALAGVPAEHIEVIYPGSHEQIQEVEPEWARSRLRDRFGIGGPFLFYVGGTDYRKNLPFLIRSFGQIRKGGYPGCLILGGETFQWDIPEVREVREAIVGEGLREFVVFPGYIPDEEIALFYSSCDFFLFPSLYEGFGLPVLEAMKCGAPVISSRASSLPEVGGEAAAYFDPGDAEQLVVLFFQLYEDEQKRDAMRQAGRIQAERFQWERAVDRLDKLYQAFETKGL